MKENNSFCQMEFTLDSEGQEILIKDGKFQVMMEWEKPYMQACIDALQPTGDVLEIGFGCGYASEHIQKHKPRSHTIIEYHPVVAEKAREWARQYPHVTIVQDTWQHAMKTLGKFDAIFFDDYPLESEKEGEAIEQSKKIAHSALAQGQKTLDEVHEMLPDLKTMTYRREDLDAFLQEAEKAPPEMYLRFFFDLKKAGQIDESLLDYALNRLLKEKRISEKDLRMVQSNEPKLFRHQGDRLLVFLQLCIKNHMRKGAVFSCYLEDPTSKYEDDRFFSEIITNPFLEYREEWIPIQVPAHCKYYSGDQALVMTIKKL